MELFKGENRVVVFGCGGHARSIRNVLYEIEKNTDILFVDGNAENKEVILGCGAVSAYSLKNEDSYIIGIGDNKKRENLYRHFHHEKTGTCISVVSPSARVGMEADIGEGSFIAFGVYIGPQARIGVNTIINTGSIVEHETIVGDHTHIAPHATVCGRARIGSHVFCGAGCVVIDKINICDHVVIGAGAVVTEDITYPGTYVGIPAKVRPDQ